MHSKPGPSPQTARRLINRLGRGSSDRSPELDDEVFSSPSHDQIWKGLNGRPDEPQVSPTKRPHRDIDVDADMTTAGLSFLNLNPQAYNPR